LTPTTSAETYSFGPFRLEPAERRLLRENDPVRLPPKALDMLVVLVLRAGRLVTKEELLAEVWPGTFVEEGNLTVNMTTLRRALGDEGGYIETVPKRGYRFIAAVASAEVQTSSTDVHALPPSVRDLGQGVQASQHARRAVPRFSALVVGVIAAAFAGWWWLRPVAAPDITSLLVVPFQTTADPSLGYLEIGMAEAVNARIAGVGAVRVPPMAAIRPGEGPFEAAARLGVDAVLTGSVQKVGERLRVTAQLSRVADRRLVWSSSFDEKFTDVFVLEDRLASRIASSVTTNLTATDRAALTRHETKNPAAYDLYLRAREQWARRTNDSVRTAIRMYEEAVTLDPDFALAYAGLADAYNLSHSGIPPLQRYPLAKAAAERAVALDANSAEAHTAVAFMRYKFEWRWAEAEKEFQRALQLDPKYALAHHWYADFLYLMGRDAESVTVFNEALILDPFSVAIRHDMARPLLHADRVAETRTLVEGGLLLNRNDSQLLAAMADVEEAEGKNTEARETRWKAQLLSGTPETQVDAQRAAYRSGGDRAVYLLQAVQFKKQVDAGRAGGATRLAQAYGKLGDKDNALAWLKTAIDLNEDAAIQLRTQPAYDSLRSDPRFAALLVRVGLAPAPK
jgi:DNA-binding winged helix-turn-helix (wHTH) protein/TolB-like protein/tetratricopeptide (TPR) repeat protein